MDGIEKADGLWQKGEEWCEKGDEIRAEPFFKSALAAFEKELGPSHMAVGVHLRKLAMYYWDRGIYTKAEKYYKRAIPIYEKNMGGDHLEVAELLDEVSELLRAMRRDDDADKLQERVESIFAKHEE